MQKQFIFTAPKIRPTSLPYLTENPIVLKPKRVVHALLTGVTEGFPLVETPPKLGSKLPNWKEKGFCDDCETGGGAPTQKNPTKHT
jgi:hypothetical protein